MSEFKFDVRVYFSDTDCEGIVYHGKYLDFAEHARSEMIKEVVDQVDLLNNHIGFVVKEINIVYNKPGFLNDDLVVKTKLISSKKFSVTLSQIVYRGEEELCDLTVKIGCINLDSKRILPISDYLKID
ncbi:MAG: YbgC/FadM family acyl-CoA thioesterase [Sphaerochaetaceae bacterium]|nr:YbgC/FadM family acyl-CoA thioesterase [Sphaerochaetaceae bacterium]